MRRIATASGRTRVSRARWRLVVVTVALGATVGAALAGCTAQDPDPEPAVVTVTAPPRDLAPTSADAERSAAPDAGPQVDARVVDHRGNRYEVVTLPLDQWDVRVDWDSQADGVMLADLLDADPSIAVATNAGIFTPQFAPGGLLVSDGVTLRDLNLADGGGNFHLMPNGVFEIRDDGTAAVVDSTAYSADGVRFATQSGPALLLAGQVHPEFREGSTNVAFRSGVGVSPDGRTVYLALSWSLTNFHDFATLFRDELGCDNALYLDGQISRLWVAGDGEPDVFAGPFAGVITARPTVQ